jgi:alkylhydroperoxidase family enzyme
MGITEEQLLGLPRYRDSGTFTELETLVLDLAVAMTATPATVTDQLRASLLEHLSPGQLAELGCAIAWENHRARLNRTLGVRAVGFTDGAVCAVPDLACPRG